MSSPPPDNHHPNALPAEFLLREYRIKEVLGVGGFGITYLAKHENFRDKYVAIKEYLPSVQAFRNAKSEVQLISGGDESVFDWGLERFFEEANNLYSLRHPGIVAVENVFKENGTAYMVMDVVKGESTAELINRKEQLTEPQLWNLFSQLTSALQVIHQQGLIHRDITPSNILYQSETQRVVLIDFGSSREQLEKTQLVSGGDHTRIFTPGYAPLEQHEGTPQDQRSDIYGLAASMYHLALHLRPAASALRAGAQRNEQPDPLIPAIVAGQGKYSDAFLETIDRGLSLLPKERPGSVQAWLDQSQLPEQGGGTVVQGIGVTQAPAAPQSVAEPGPVQETGERSAPAALADAVLERLPASPAIRAGLVAGALVVLLGLSHLTGLVDLPGLTTASRMMDRASTALVADPMSRSAVAEASEYFTKAKLLDDSESAFAQARAGEDLCETVTAFQAAVAQRDLPGAERSYERAVGLADTAGVDAKAIAALAAVLEVERLYDRLSAQFEATMLRRDEVAAIAESLASLRAATTAVLAPEADRLAAAGAAVTAVQGAQQAFAAPDFDQAVAQLAQVTGQLPPIGYGALNVRRAEQRVAVERARYVEDKLQAVTDGVLAAPTDASALAVAKTNTDAARNADSSSKPARLWGGVVQGLQSALASIDRGAPDRARERVNELVASARAVGVSQAQWRDVALAFDNLGIARTLDDVVASLRSQPYGETGRAALRQQLEAAQSFAASNTVGPALQARLTAAERLGQTLRQSAQAMSAHRYADAAKAVQAVGSDLTVFPAGAELQTALAGAVESARQAERDQRWQSLQQQLGAYQLPASRQALLDAADRLQAIDPAGEKVTSVRALVEGLASLQGSALAHDYAAAREASAQATELAASLSVPSPFAAALTAWLTSQGEARGESLLSAALGKFAKAPLDADALEAFGASLGEIGSVLQAVGGDAAGLAQLTEALPGIRDLAASSISGQFAAARTELDRQRIALAGVSPAVEPWLNATGDSLDRRQANYRTELHLTVTDGLDRAYLGLRRSPLDEGKLTSAVAELNTLIELQSKVDPEVYDWAVTAKVKAVLDSLVAARRLAEVDLDYLQATKTLVKTSLGLRRNSRWRRVLETARTTLETRKNEHVDRLLAAASAALAEGSLQSPALATAVDRYNDVVKIEQSDAGAGQLGLDLVAYLQAQTEHVSAGATENLDVAAIAAAQDRFGALPGADGALKQLAGAATTQISAQEAQAQQALLALLGQGGPSRRAALTALNQGADRLAQAAQGKALPVAEAAAVAVGQIADALIQAESFLDERRYNSAHRALIKARGMLREETLDEAVKAPLKTLYDAQRNLTRTYRIRRLGTYNNGIERAVGHLRTTPLAAQSQGSARAEVEQVLAEHAEFEPALRVVEIIDALAALPQAEGPAACAVLETAKAAGDRIDFPLDWTWLEQLQARTCPN